MLFYSFGTLDYFEPNPHIAPFILRSTLGCSRWFVWDEFSFSSQCLLKLVQKLKVVFSRSSKIMLCIWWENHWINWGHKLQDRQISKWSRHLVCGRKSPLSRQQFFGALSLDKVMLVKMPTFLYIGLEIGFSTFWRFCSTDHQRKCLSI